MYDAEARTAVIAEELKELVEKYNAAFKEANEKQAIANELYSQVVIKDAILKEINPEGFQAPAAA